MFDHRSEFEGRDLEVASQHVSGSQLVHTFTKVGIGGRGRRGGRRRRRREEGGGQRNYYRYYDYYYHLIIPTTTTTLTTKCLK